MAVLDPTLPARVSGSDSGSELWSAIAWEEESADEFRRQRWLRPRRFFIFGLSDKVYFVSVRTLSGKMERRLNGPNGGAASTRSSPTALQPNYSNRSVQEALEHLASIDLIDLCKEAKIERCRATRDLRSCGRYVHHVLNSCGHASLCAECSQRCDICPICRISIPKTGSRLQQRLYYECIEAGLISKRCDERFQEIEDSEKQLTADVQRLYSMFDVALENNLVSLICHYVTDVCMDETAVSSDPVIAFLLDEVVVKDWCKSTFKIIITELQGIYDLDIEGMKNKLSLLLKFTLYLAGISNVLEVLESSFKGTLSAQLHDLHHLQESISKTKQHLEIIIWCTRHEFLEDVRSRFTDISSWAAVVRERKSAAIKRAWPDAINQPVEPTRQAGSLFIEDALNNLELEEGLMKDIGEGLEVASLQKDVTSIFRANIDGVLGCYPFKNLRAAADLLFLRGSSDMVIAKQAIFLYFLYDRHWTIPDEEWRDIVEDFAATFSISRHSLLESLIFYLLDDHTEEALQEACRLLPEISGPASHPKIAEILLERNSPDTALMVLRWAGRDGGSQMISLRDAVTAVRVRVECGLLTESFMHQRLLYTRVKEKKLNHGAAGDTFDKLKGQYSGWLEWVEALVTEICCLCIRRNWVDRMIELPWNSDEEKYIHKCLLDYAVEDPLKITGSLLVVFYIQRYRYAEAYQVHLKLEKMEQESTLEVSFGEEVLSRRKTASHWRANLIDRCLELLPEVEQRQLRSGKLTEGAVTSDVEVEIPAQSDDTQIQDSRSTSLLVPSSANSTLVMHADHTTGLSRSSTYDTSRKIGRASSIGPELGRFGSPSSHREWLFTSNDRGSKHQGNLGKNLRYDTSTPRNHRIRSMNGSPLRGVNRTSPSNSQDTQDKISTRDGWNQFLGHDQNSSPMYSWKATANPVTGSTPNYSKESTNDLLLNMSSRKSQSHKDDRNWNVASSDDPMDVSWSHTEGNLAIEESNMSGGPRWRSDEETGDEEEEKVLERAMGIAYNATPARRTRRSRFTKR
ncbi:E3 ubiquitin-protein ligase HOS1 [Senna tora]|uniref:E3 ubiquitin-protein ligase HOS1 n=1 Tax=Senna tora TaxID=362788 RepID=A0A834TTY8_9FABA|nr:E3 ubiquitin-protein ligase HOS1 [Senna tora]